MRITEQRPRWSRRNAVSNNTGDPWMSQPCVLWKLTQDEGKYVRKVTVNELPSLGITNVKDIGGSDYAILIDTLLHTPDGHAFDLETAKIYTYTCNSGQQQDNIKYTDTGKISTAIKNKVSANTRQQVQYISSTPQAKQMQQTLVSLSEKYSSDAKYNGFPSPGSLDGIVGKKTLASFNALYDYVRANYNTTNQTQTAPNRNVDSLERIQTLNPKEVQPQSLSEIDWIKKYPCITTDRFDEISKDENAYHVNDNMKDKSFIFYSNGRFREDTTKRSKVKGDFVTSRIGSFHCNCEEKTNDGKCSKYKLMLKVDPENENR